MKWGWGVLTVTGAVTVTVTITAGFGGVTGSGDFADSRGELSVFHAYAHRRRSDVKLV